MTPTRTLTLALVLALCALCAQTAHAQTPVCKIYGTVDSVAGPTSTLTTTRAQITVTRASKSGSLFLNTSRVFNADATGRIEFYAPRTVGTDTAVIHIRANFGDLSAGQTVYVPDADSAELRTLPRYTANPQLVVVAVPTGGGSGDTSLNGHPRLTRIENVEGQFTPSTSDSLQQIAASVFVARNVAEGKADADSVKLSFDRLGDRADADSLASVKTTADGAFQRADTNALHAQKFKVIDNRFGDRADADSLASVKSTADAALPKADTSALHAQRFADITTSLASKLQWTDTTGFFARYGGVMTEADPTALAKASSALDSSLTNGSRSISTTGRMFASDDSITFVGEAGDVINAALGNVFRGTLSANDTLSITGMVDGQVITIIVTNAGTNTLGWTGVNWAGGTVPTLSATANKRDAFTIIRAGGIMYGSYVQDLR